MDCRCRACSLRIDSAFADSRVWHYTPIILLSSEWPGFRLLHVARAAPYAGGCSIAMGGTIGELLLWHLSGTPRHRGGFGDALRQAWSFIDALRRVFAIRVRSDCVLWRCNGHLDHPFVALSRQLDVRGEAAG